MNLTVCIFWPYTWPAEIYWKKNHTNEQGGSTVNSWSPTQLDPQYFLLVLVLIISQHFHSSQPVFPNLLCFKHHPLISASLLACYFMLDNLYILIFVSFPMPHHSLTSSPILATFLRKYVSPVSEKMFLLFKAKFSFWCLILFSFLAFLESYSFL